jgi:hypothetical protein
VKQPPKKNSREFSSASISDLSLRLKKTDREHTKARKRGRRRKHRQDREKRENSVERSVYGSEASWRRRDDIEWKRP